MFLNSLSLSKKCTSFLGISISGCSLKRCRKAVVPPFCVPQIKKSTLLLFINLDPLVGYDVCLTCFQNINLPLSRSDGFSTTFQENIASNTTTGKE